MTRKEVILRWQNIIVVAAIMIVMFISVLIGNYQTTKFWGSYKVATLDNWTLSDEEEGEREVSFPSQYVMVKNMPFTLHGQLPDRIDDNYGIMLQTNYAAIEVYVEGALVNSYAKELPLPYGTMTGNIRMITYLGKEYAGKHVDIKITPYYNSKMTLNPILQGNIEALKLYVVFKNLWKMILTLILFTVAAVSVGISIYHFIHTSSGNNWAFYHIGAMLFYLQYWLVCSSDIPQFFTNANELVSVCSFLALAIVPIHMAAFCEELLPSKNDIFRKIQIVGWCIPALELFGFVTNLWDPNVFMFPTHIMIILCIFTAIVEGLINNDNSSFVKSITMANLILVVTIIIALVSFYVAPTSGIDAVCVGIGIVVYSFYLFSIVLKREAKYLEDSQAKNIYQELAFKDMQTNLKNRGAFNNALAEVDQGKRGPVQIDLVIMDLNYLKKTNDAYGHLAGDELIVAAAQCINQAFSCVGECYRIGGDEFAVLGMGKHYLLGEAIKKFEEEIALYNSIENSMLLSVSLGTANGIYDGNQKFMEHLFTEADKAMYKQKKHFHMHNN